MTIADAGVVVGSAGLITLLGWYFFGPKRTRLAELRDGIQQVDVTLKAGYSPDLIRVRQGVPVRIRFDRRESGECTSRVVFADLAVSKPVPAFGTATVEFTPRRPGRIDFACGMNMVHGAVLVEPATGNGDTATVPAPPEEPVIPSQPAPAEEDDEEADRRAEVADLSRRVLLGAVLSAPVVLAVMLHEFLGVAVPEVLLNRWVQLALITPVMVYTGWPIHRTGWLALRHRAAEMNSLITLGTTAAYGYSLLVTLAPGVLPAGVREVYFEAVGVILTLILLGRLFEAKAKAGRRSARCSDCGPGPPAWSATEPKCRSRPRTSPPEISSRSGRASRSPSTAPSSTDAPQWTSPWSPASRCP